jgi:hypothetical protein
MQVPLDKLERHLALWRAQAEEYGWADTHPNMTIWIRDGQIEDSVMTRDGSDMLFIQKED